MIPMTTNHAPESPECTCPPMWPREHVGRHHPKCPLRNARITVSDIHQEDLVDLTFEVAEKIAQWLLKEAESTPDDIPQHDRNGHDYLCWAAYKIRTGAWREGWDRDPANNDPRGQR